MNEYTREDIESFLGQANLDLGSGKYSGDDMIPDYAKAVLIGKQLQADLQRHYEALEECRDTLVLCMLIDKSGQAKEAVGTADEILEGAK